MKTLFAILVLIWTTNAFSQTATDSYNKGNVKANSKDFENALKDFDQAIKLDSTYTDAYYNRGTTKMHLKDYSGAISDFDKAIELKPDFINAYMNRAVAKIKSYDLKGAIIDFDSAIKLDPGNAPAYFMRGQMKLQTNYIDSGCDDLIKSKELGDNRAVDLIEQYCKKNSDNSIENNAIESLMIDWPDSEGWRVANQEDNAEQKRIELLRNDETFENWTEIGTMTVYKNINSSINISMTKKMDLLYDGSKKICPSAKLTLIEKDENAKYPWIIFKIECSSDETESQVWLLMQGTHELFFNSRAVKQKTVPDDLQDKWVKFFKTVKIVTQQ